MHRFDRRHRLRFPVGYRTFVNTVDVMCRILKEKHPRMTLNFFTSENESAYIDSTNTIWKDGPDLRTKYPRALYTEDAWNRSLETEAIWTDDTAKEPIMIAMSVDHIQDRHIMRFYMQQLDEVTCARITQHFAHPTLWHAIGDGYRVSSSPSRLAQLHRNKAASS
jgi:hypothetical protein